MVPYGRQFIDEQDVACVLRALKAPFLTRGPEIKAFERELAAYCGARFAVVVNSGTSALLAAYAAAGLGPGDEVLVPANTFSATSNALLWLGARPVFVDIESETGNLSLDGLETYLSPATRAVVPVHYAGRPVELAKLRDWASRYGLLVIEDACHALGARYLGTPVGSGVFSDLTVFSFHPLKSITTGEGGAILTNREDFYERLCLFRDHGFVRETEKFQRSSPGPWYHEMQLLGLNLWMTDFQAALGRSQLKKLDQFVTRRREIATRYLEAFTELDEAFNLPLEDRPASQSAWHLFVIRLKEHLLPWKEKIVRYLQGKGIGTQVHYLPVYLHPFYQKLGYREGLCPKAEHFYRCALSLPLFPALKDDEVEYIIQTVRNIFNSFVSCCRINYQIKC